MEPTKAIRSLRALAQALRAVYQTSPSASAEAVALDLEAQASQLERTVALAQAEERARALRPYELGACDCKRGVARDNCAACEGTGFRIDFAKLRAQPTSAEATKAEAQACATACQCEHYSHTELGAVSPNGNPGHRYGQRFYRLRAVATSYGTFQVCEDCAQDCLQAHQIRS